jgi:PAS domain S-box-containing protein
MKKQKSQPGGSPRSKVPLRRKAGAQFAEIHPQEEITALSRVKLEAILHELRTHQIELEMQNAELLLAHEALNDSRAEYIKLYNLAPVGYITVSGQGVIEEANLTATKLLDYTHSTLVKQPVTRFIHKGDQDIYYKMHKHLVGTREPQSCELRMLRPEGTSIWTLLECSLTQTESKEPSYHLVFNDITDRKRAEEEIAMSEKKYRRLHESLMDGFVSVAMDGRIFECNELYLTMLGYSMAELTQLSYMDVTPEKWHAIESDIVNRQILKRGYSDVYEKEYRRKDGSVFPVELRAILIRDEHEPPSGIWAIVRNITERKQAQEDLLRKNAEIEAFTYTVSHDLKSPLVTIKTFLGYLEEDLEANRAETVAKDLGYLRGAADKMELMLNELLKLARIGHLRNPSGMVPLQEIVSEALELVAGQIAEAGVQVEITPEPVCLYGERQRLVQLFQNLVDNAVKFMGDQPAPRIEIGVEQEKDEIVLFVRDNGKGIDPRHRAKLFGLFEKLDTDTPGSGIGLSTVQRIVRLHGGKIDAHSDGLGQGSTFRFTLAKSFSNDRPLRKHDSVGPSHGNIHPQCA